MTHADIINRWPSLSAFAEDIEVAYGTAKAMRRRGSIPPAYWPLAVQRAPGRGVVVDITDFLPRHASLPKTRGSNAGVAL